ncbi:MAG: transglutaminase domain-containing protein [Treponema sp.]
MKRSKLVGVLSIGTAVIFISCADMTQTQSALDKTQSQSTKQTEQNEKQPPQKPGKRDTAQTQEPSYSDYEAKKQELFKRLLNACTRFEETASVGDLHISCTENGETRAEHKALYAEFFDRHPYIFHLRENGSIGIRYKSENENEVNEYIFEYLTNKDSFETEYKEFEEGMEAMYSVVQEGMSEAECSYALCAALDKRTVYKDVHGLFDKATPRGPIVLGKAVCEGYSLAYKKLVTGIGIPAQFVSGPAAGSEGHMWNRIQIDGQWYNMDATWDDYGRATADYRAHCRGSYFLTSDNVFYGVRGHLVPNRDEEKALKPALSKRYDDASCVFRNLANDKGELQYRNGWWYYFSFADSTIYKSRFDGAQKEPVYTKKTAKYRLENSMPLLARVELGQTKIYFMDLQEDNTPNAYALYSVNFDGSDVQKIESLSSVPVMLVPNTDKVVRTYGIEALKAELMLSKMKDAYFHGTEDLETPQSETRVCFTNAIKEAEALLAENAPDTAHAALLYEKLHALRKSYSFPRTSRS